jgi:hypothetical protein
MVDVLLTDNEVIRMQWAMSHKATKSLTQLLTSIEEISLHCQ